MNCVYHPPNNPIIVICKAPHLCAQQRKLCIQCLNEHEVDQQHIVPIQIFRYMITQKLNKYRFEYTTKLENYRLSFTQFFTETQKTLNNILKKVSESVYQIFNIIEQENNLILNLINKSNNLVESSDDDLEKLVTVLDGETLNDWITQQNSYLIQLKNEENYIVNKVQAFCGMFQKGMMENIQSIKIKLIQQVYERKTQFFEVLASLNNIDEQLLDIIIKMMRKVKSLDCIEFLQNTSNLQYMQEFLSQEANISHQEKENKFEDFRTSIQFLINILKNIQNLEFNQKNYSLDEFQEKRKKIINQISHDEKTVHFMIFLVKLTAIDSRFIQSGSNSLNLLVEMKVNLQGQNFEDIKIKNTLLIGGHFVRCNLSGSQFNNVDISGINLNCAQLLNCQWVNLKLNQLNNINNGHSGPVLSVCFSPDGTSLASCGEDNSIRLWDIKTGQEKAKLLGHSKQVLSICLSPDGTTLASSSGDCSICLWNILTGNQVAKLYGHDQCVYSVCFSFDGTRLASGSSDKSICLWDAETGEQIVKFNCNASVFQVCFSPDDTIIASCSNDASIHLWNVKTKKVRVIIFGHSGANTSICFSPDGNTLASSSQDTFIRFWDVRTGRLKAKFYSKSHVLSICFSPDGTILASGGFNFNKTDFSIYLWDVMIRKQKTTLKGHNNNVLSVCFSPNGVLLASSSRDNSILLWEVNSVQETMPQENRLQNILLQVKIPNDKISLLQKAASNIIILCISQQQIFQSQGALILKGEFTDQSGRSLKSYFNFKGSLILENLV